MLGPQRRQREESRASGPACSCASASPSPWRRARSPPQERIPPRVRGGGDRRTHVREGGMPLATSIAPTRIGVRGPPRPECRVLAETPASADRPSATPAQERVRPHRLLARGVLGREHRGGSTSPAERWTSDSRNRGRGVHRSSEWFSLGETESDQADVTPPAEIAPQPPLAVAAMVAARRATGPRWEPLMSRRRLRILHQTQGEHPMRRSRPETARPDLLQGLGNGTARRLHHGWPLSADAFEDQMYLPGLQRGYRLHRP